MKQFLTLATIVASIFSAFSQEKEYHGLNYNDLGVIFSNNNNYGTARFEAMSGAFGALGGDISSITINPAGAVVSKTSSLAFTLNGRNSTNQSKYYGTNTNSQDTFFNMSQAGGTLVFDTPYNSDWNRFALSFNYSLKNDFENFYTAQGNSERLYYNEHIGQDAPRTIFDRSLEQFISNKTTGTNSVLNIGFSAVHQNKLYLGSAINFHDLSFSQESIFNEVNDAADGTILDAENLEEINIQATGVSLSLGFIYKPIKSIRLGLAYETPTWYQEVVENYYKDIDMLAIDNLDVNGINNVIDDAIYSYKLRTPSRITASSAFIFKKKGLISIDYTYKDYTSINYSGGNFTTENTNFLNSYRDTHAINIGTEWRFNNISLRGGYHYQTNPDLILGGNTNKDNIKGFSTGLGYNFGNTKIDISYQKRSNSNYYRIYDNNDLEVANNTSRISGTITFNL